MTTTLGGVTLRDPDTPVEIYAVFVGQQTEAHDGTLIADYTAQKLGWRLNWSVLTEAQRNTIRTQADKLTTQTFKPPYTTTNYNVVVKQDTVIETVHAGDNNDYYTFAFDVEEVS